MVAVILCRPQLAENVGAVARVMANFGLAELRLVAPLPGVPGERGEAVAVHGVDVLKRAVIFPDIRPALRDLHLVLAFTARRRRLRRPPLSPEACCLRIRQLEAGGQRCGVLFGPERTGLERHELALAGEIVSIPADPACPSLNLGQSVAVFAYEWARTGTPPRPAGGRPGKAATRGEIDDLIEHLATELDESGYFARIPRRRPVILANLRDTLNRCSLLHQDVRSLRGFVHAIARKKGLRRRPGAGREQTPEAEGTGPRTG